MWFQKISTLHPSNPTDCHWNFWMGGQWGVDHRKQLLSLRASSLIEVSNKIYLECKQHTSTPILWWHKQVLLAHRLTTTTPWRPYPPPPLGYKSVPSDLVNSWSDFYNLGHEPARSLRRASLVPITALKYDRWILQVNTNNEMILFPKVGNRIFNTLDLW